MSKPQKASVRQAAQNALDEQIALSSRLQQVWTENTPLTFALEFSLAAPSPNGDVVLGRCTLTQPITGVVPDNFRCRGDWAQFLSGISDVELPIQQACMQGCQQIVGEFASLLANTLLIQGASVPDVKNKRLAVTRPVGLMTIFGTSSIPVLRSLASVECGVNGHEHLKTREVTSQICEAVSYCSVRKGVQLLNHCQGRTGENIIPTATAHRVIKANGRQIQAHSTSVVAFEQALELSCLASELAQAHYDAIDACRAIATTYDDCDVYEESGLAAEACNAAKKASAACHKVHECLRSKCEQEQIEQALSRAIEAVEVARKTAAEAKSACTSLVQTDGNVTRPQDVAYTDGDTSAKTPCRG